MSTIEQATRDFWFADTLGRVLVSGEQTEGRSCVVEVRGRRDSMPPLHVHPVDDEIFHVLDGEISVYHGAQVVRLGAGDTALAPRGVPHTYRIESETARVLVTGTPAGFDRFIEAFGVPAARLEIPAGPVEPDFAAVAELERETGYRVEILGPPGALPA
jgi:quercetin dioxygenase-like cupin family protein